MPRKSLLFTALLIVSAASLVAYVYGPNGQRASQGANAQADRATAQTPPSLSVVQIQHVAAGPTAESPDAIANWQAGISSDDPKTRAAAIDALSRAPSAQSVPVLQRVLSVGDNADRHLALQALRTLAQRQGDADNRIRDALRVAIYHGDSDTATSDAQQALDAVEHDLSGAAPRSAG
jgi:hypothetical protein